MKNTAWHSSKLPGMFAFALYDSSKKTVILAAIDREKALVLL